jgi:hypothetical protein
MVLFSVGDHILARVPPEYKWISGVVMREIYPYYMIRPDDSGDEFECYQGRLRRALSHVDGGAITMRRTVSERIKERLEEFTESLESGECI